MPLQYGAVAREAVILADYSLDKNKYEEAIRQCLQKLPERQGRIATEANGLHLYFLFTKEDLGFVALSDTNCGRRVPFFFLEEIKQKFEAQFLAQAKSAPEKGLQKQFSPQIQQVLEYCAKQPESSLRLQEVQGKVQDVKDVMIENIEQVLQRGEKLDKLENKADALRNQAEVFQKKSNKLKRRFCWENCKLKLIFAGLIFLAIVLIVLLVCFAGGQICMKR